VAALVVSESETNGAPLDDTVATISRFAGRTDVLGVPRLASDASGHPAFARIAALL
jgi:hypothetical protein